MDMYVHVLYVTVVNENLMESVYTYLGITSDSEGSLSSKRKLCTQYSISLLLVCMCCFGYDINISYMGLLFQCSIGQCIYLQSYLKSSACAGDN